MLHAFVYFLNTIFCHVYWRSIIVIHLYRVLWPFYSVSMSLLGWNHQSFLAAVYLLIMQRVLSCLPLYLFEFLWYQIIALRFYIFPSFLEYNFLWFRILSSCLRFYFKLHCLKSYSIPYCLESHSVFLSECTCLLAFRRLWCQSSFWWWSLSSSCSL